MNYKGIIDNIIDLASDKLNSWEQGFMDNMHNRYYNNIDLLSVDQKKMLRKIQDKYLKHN